jgi:hypothetical protein
MGRLVLFLAGIIAGVAATLVYVGIVTIPPAWSPWGPLDLTAEPGAFTRLQLAGLKGEPETCFAALEKAGIRVTRLPDRPAEGTAEDGCGLVDVARVERTSIPYSSSFVATCPLIAALVLFERHTLIPAAERHLDADVTRINHVGTYSCRNIYGRTEGRRSEHATANAIDLRGFVLDDGRIISLARHWNAGGQAVSGQAVSGRADAGQRDSDPAAFLRELDDGACRFFNAVLGPDYNAAHRDHFHLDMGRWRVCR